MMSKLRKVSASRFVLAVALVAVGIVAYVASMPTADAVICSGITVYYNNAAYKKVIGARGTGCCGSVINWGQTSPYVRCEVLYCTDQVCPN